AVEWDTALGKGFGHGKPAGPCTDDTVTLHNPSLCLLQRASFTTLARPKHPPEDRSTPPRAPALAASICVKSPVAQAFLGFDLHSGGSLFGGALLYGLTPQKVSGELHGHQA